MSMHADLDATRRAESKPAPVPLVLVVDDSADMRALLREVLASAGYEVVAAGSSAQALAVMSERVPDLVITDLMMPGMSGITLRSLMLRRAELATVPVIVLSAYWARPGETLDAVAVLTKPIDLDRLLATVRSALATGASHEPGTANAAQASGSGSTKTRGRPARSSRTG